VEDQPADDGAVSGRALRCLSFSARHPDRDRQQYGPSIDATTRATGMDAFVATFVLSCDLGVAKPAPEPFLTACERLDVAPDRTLMVGNNRLADSGSICIGCHCLILPPVPPGATRGLRAAADVAGIAWVA
jgi:FMN phosphatase YigB (HAD superfamily)